MFSGVFSSRTSSFSGWQVLAGAAASGVALAATANASSNVLQPAKYPWNHSGPLDAYDRASVRRGYQVYKQVCSQCHGMKFLAFRNLVGETHTEEQAKALAESFEITDGPNDAGEMFQRPGKLSDYFPEPYPNEEAARAANGGALPPDLSVIVKARGRAEDYIFALLTGYKEPPAGVSLRSGLYYNPYMSGGAIAMPQPLYDEMVDYEDGTKPTLSQHAKDVTTFLAWASMPEQDERKLFGFRSLLALTIGIALTVYYKRFRWAVIKNQKLSIKNSVY